MERRASITSLKIHLGEQVEGTSAVSVTFHKDEVFQLKPCVRDSEVAALLDGVLV
jgi:hypothetical protein